MKKSAIKKAIADRKTYSVGTGHSQLWEDCHRRSLPFIREDERMDAKWGFAALPRLVGAETAAIWAKTADNWWRAMDAADDPNANPVDAIAAVEACVASCLRGLTTMDAEAHKLHPHGVQPPESFEYKSDDQRFVVVADSLDAHFAKPGTRVVTMQEVAAAIAYHDKLVVTEEKIRAHFPDAKITKVRPREVPEDEITF